MFILLQYRANAPIIDQLLAQAGFTGGNPVEAVLSAVKATPTTAVQPVAPVQTTATDS